MRLSSLLSVALSASLALAVPQLQFTSTDPGAIATQAATAKTSSPTSHVKGKAFDRFVVIFNENTDFESAVADPNFSFFADQGVLMTNFFAVTHPSEPNYIGSFGGEYFGMDNDDFSRVPKNVSTIADLLDDKEISWGLYQEDLPYSGFEGFSYSRWIPGKNDYVRKHNPAIVYDSISSDPDRLALIKNFTMFDKDLEEDKLPQWMFITPNMTNDGHDTTTEFTGAFTKKFLGPLLTNKKFMKNTLVLLTFDESETYEAPNRVWAVLLGDALPDKYKGTRDDNFYNHYSGISTIEANWDLHTLGRWDVGANVFKPVAEKTGDRIRKPTNPDLDDLFYNSSYAGIFNTGGPGLAPLPAPDVHARRHGRTVLPMIKEIWESKAECGEIYYGGHPVQPASGQNPPKVGVGC